MKPAGRVVAVLGAGILGSSTACWLSMRGVRCTLIDQAPAPMHGASRWNEGKIHLGYLYAGSGALRTARRVIAGGLSFRPAIERLLERSIGDWITPARDHYLIHRDSIAGVDRTARYFDAVDRIVRRLSGRFAYMGERHLPPVERIEPASLAGVDAASGIEAAFRTPERSVSTRLVADALAARVLADPAIDWQGGLVVARVARRSDGRFLVHSDRGVDGPFDAVVNALWEGRPAVDRASGHPSFPGVNHHYRYRLSIFATRAEPELAPSAVVAFGPFGDVKHYGDGDYYLSWYPAGLLSEAEGGNPPPAPVLDRMARDEVRRTIVDRLSDFFPGAGRIVESAEACRLAGGWVYAAASGSLQDPASSLHRRDGFGINACEGYYSIDTGKYSTAPRLAYRVASRIMR